MPGGLPTLFGAPARGGECGVHNASPTSPHLSSPLLTWPRPAPPHSTPPHTTATPQNRMEWKRSHHLGPTRKGSRGAGRGGVGRHPCGAALPLRPCSARHPARVATLRLGSPAGPAKRASHSLAPGLRVEGPIVTSCQPRCQRQPAQGNVARQDNLCSFLRQFMKRALTIPGMEMEMIAEEEKSSL